MSKPPPFPNLQIDCVSNFNETNSESTPQQQQQQQQELPFLLNSLDKKKKEGLNLLFAASLLRSSSMNNIKNNNDDEIYHSSTISSLPSSAKTTTTTTTFPPCSSDTIQNISSLSFPLASRTTATTATTTIPGALRIIPQPNDVLCGRGGGIHQNLGNRIYRRLVEYNKPMYRQCPKRHRQFISQSIVQVLINNHGRFLQRYTNSKDTDNMDDSTNTVIHNTTDDDVKQTNDKNTKKNEDTWIEISFHRAVQKTSQALRERDI